MTTIRCGKSVVFLAFFRSGCGQPYDPWPSRSPTSRAESAGVVSCDSSTFHTHKGLGHVHRVFKARPDSLHLPGSMAIGHVRYATAGDGGSATSNLFMPI